MLAFAALHYFLLWWRSRRERVLLIFSIFAAIVSVVIAVTVSLVAADSIESAQRALNLRTTFGFLAYPLLLWLVAEIASVRPGRLVKGLTVIALVVAIISAFGVRINGTVTGLSEMRLPWGEALSVVQRDSSVYPDRARVHPVVVRAGTRAAHRMACLAARSTRQHVDRIDGHRHRAGHDSAGPC